MRVVDGVEHVHRVGLALHQTRTYNTAQELGGRYDDCHVGNIHMGVTGLPPPQVDR